jgi:putative tricarboxylic transport membrane protein
VAGSRTNARQSGGRVDIAELVIGLALLALAGVIVFDAQRLEPGSMYGVGPSVAPMIVAGGLVLLGILTVLAAWRPRAADDAAESAIDWAAVADIMGVLVGFVVLIILDPGFVFASTVLFGGTAWAFGRRTPVVDGMIGFALALVIYGVFTKLLTLSLPEGAIDRLVSHALDAASAWLKVQF